MGNQIPWELMAQMQEAGGEQAAIDETVDDAAAMPQVPINMLQQLESDPYAIQELQQLAQRSAAAQQGELAPMEAQIAKLQAGGAGGNADILPLLALSDAWAGTDFTKSLRGGMTADQRAAKIAQLQSALAKRKSDIARGELEAKRTDVYGKQRAERMLMKKESELSKELDKNIMNPIRKRGEQFNNLEAAFAAGGYQQVLGILAQYARGISGEKGVLTDRDISRVMPTKTLVTLKADIQRFFSKNPNAELPVEFVKPLREMMAVSRVNAAKEYNKYINGREKIYKARKSFKDVFDSGAGGEMFDIARESVENFKPSKEDIRLYNEIEARGKRRRGSLLKQGGDYKQRNIANDKLEAAKLWLQKNPNHPKAEAIRARIGGR